MIRIAGKSLYQLCSSFSPAVRTVFRRATREMQDGAWRAIIDQRRSVAIGGPKTGHVPPRFHSREKPHGLARQQADGKTIEWRLQSRSQRFQIRFFARPTAKKCLGSLLGRQRSQIANFASRKIPPRDVLARGFRLNQLDVNTKVSLPGNCVHRQPRRMRQIERNSIDGVCSRKRRLSIRSIGEFQAAGHLAKIPAEQFTEQAASHDEPVAVFCKMITVRPGFFIRRERQLKPGTLALFSLQPRRPHVDLVPEFGPIS
jgi:hypothetical protein